MTEQNIFMQLSEMDSAHAYFSTLEDEEMRKGLYELRDYYEENPDVHTWDLEAIGKKYAPREFYIINAQNRMEVTTHEPSENFDFNECCAEFVRLIQERLQTDEFYFDGLENSAATRDAWMYSYLATPDHRYLMEFGTRFGDTSVSKYFGYEETVSNLLTNNPALRDLRLLTYEGFVLNFSTDLMTIDDLDADIRRAYYNVIDTGKVSEVRKVLTDGYIETHRFLPYQAEETRGNATQRIIYAKYDNAEELAISHKNNRIFSWMAGVGIVTAVIAMLIILKIFTKTIRLATYDTLTGAYNRASYLQHMNSLIESRSADPIGLMLVDLDNFKKLNDEYGHAEGDVALRELTMILKEIAQKKGYVVRFGGDEFGIVYERVDEEKLQVVAESILQRVRTQHEKNPLWSILSVSIGATLQKESREAELELFKRADEALYMSKRRGKDTYTYLLHDEKRMD
ncbi:MAG: GGDEF domain-containing protein [Caryophanon sp.]|nr:GGDEF domain-containing protein [Caryophanon sp.]